MRRLFVVMSLLLAPATALASTVQAPSVDRDCRTQAEIVGFSRNEQLLAVRYRVACPQADGSRDELVLGSMVDAHNGRIVQLFAAEVTRNVAAGRRTLVTDAALAARYPRLGRLLDAASWQRLLGRGHFTALRHDFADASVRLRLLTPGNVRLVAEHKDLRVHSADAVQFAVVGRLADGSHVDVAQLRHPGNAKAPARLRVLYSQGGHRVAAVWSDGLGGVQIDLLATPEDVRFGSNKMGVPSVVTGTADEVETIYKALHPHSAQIWDENVGEAY